MVKFNSWCGDDRHPVSFAEGSVFIRGRTKISFLIKLYQKLARLCKLACFYLRVSSVLCNMKQNKQHDYAGDSHQNSQRETATQAVDPIGENIETIADMHKHAELRVNPHQRTIEKVTAFLGRPRFFYIILISVTLWILVNALLPKFGIPNFDPPPFYWLQAILSVGTIFITTVILITQKRLDRETERRIQLDLHIGLLAD